MENNERITLELCGFDVKLILECLHEKEMSKRVWGCTNPNDYPPRYGYVETKESRRYKSTANYIRKQLND